MSEILNDIQVKFPKFDLKKLNTGQAKKIANSFFKTKKSRGMFGTKDLKNIKHKGGNVFSSFEENEKKFYRLELTTEQ